MMRIIRFMKQHKIVCYIFVLSSIICFIHIFTKDVPELFPYAGEIFDFIYNLLLAYMASVFFLFVDSFLEKDVLQEKYENKMVRQLKSINEKMKEIVHIVIKTPNYWRDYHIIDIDYNKVDRVFNANKDGISCKERITMDETKSIIENLASCEAEIIQRVETIISTYGKFLSEKDIDFLMDIQDIELCHKIMLCQKYNLNYTIKRKSMDQHIEMQRKIENRINEIEASIK